MYSKYLLIKDDGYQSHQYVTEIQRHEFEYYYNNHKTYFDLCWSKNYAEAVLEQYRNIYGTMGYNSLFDEDDSEGDI